MYRLLSKVLKEKKAAPARGATFTQPAVNQPPTALFALWQSRLGPGRGGHFKPFETVK